MNDNELLESLGVQNDEVIKHKPTTTRKFYYESYVRKVLGDNEKHFEELMKEYRAVYDEYQETKKFPEMPSLVNNLPPVKEEQNVGGTGDNQAQGQQQAAPAGKENDKDKDKKEGEQKQNETSAKGEKKAEEKKEEEKK